MGDSVASPTLYILAAQIPSAPNSVVKLSQDKTSIRIQWFAPSSDGSSPITGYKVYWDDKLGSILPISIG